MKLMTDLSLSRPNQNYPDQTGVIPSSRRFRPPSENNLDFKYSRIQNEPRSFKLRKWDSCPSLTEFHFKSKSNKSIISHDHIESLPSEMGHKILEYLDFPASISLLYSSKILSKKLAPFIANKLKERISKMENELSETKEKISLEIKKRQFSEEFYNMLEDVLNFSKKYHSEAWFDGFLLSLIETTQSFLSGKNLLLGTPIEKLLSFVDMRKNQESASEELIAASKDLHLLFARKQLIANIEKAYQDLILRSTAETTKNTQLVMNTHLLSQKQRNRLRQAGLSLAALMTFVVLFRQIRYRPFKAFYLKQVFQRHL